MTQPLSGTSLHITPQEMAWALWIVTPGSWEAYFQELYMDSRSPSQNIENLQNVGTSDNDRDEESF